MGRAIDELGADLAVAWKPPPRLLVSEWTNGFRYLSSESSAEPGRWKNARAPHLVAPMDALSPYDEAEKVVCKFCSQSGKTEVILNFIGYIMDLDPGPILAIQPNVSPMGEAFSKDRINPMLRDSPTLAVKSGPLKSRTTASTILHKTFQNGHLTIAGANSPAGLASRPIRYLVCDELDRWEITKEGDPLVLARKRQQTFRARRRAKELDVSSPTYDDIGISYEYDGCSQAYEWHLTCQHCGETQFPKIEHFSWDDVDESTTRYACQACGGVHSLADENKVKASGAWVCVREGSRKSVGYWFNQFSSPFARWDDTIREWLDAQGDGAKMQAVVNTSFATGWEGEGEKIEPHVLRAREQPLGDILPDWVRMITIGADCQADRIEAEVVGWGERKESISLDYRVFPGEPSTDDVWNDLLEFYREPWDATEGRKMLPSCMCIDSGAFTQHVYDFVKRARDKGIIPVKGAAGMTREQIDADVRARMKRMAKRMRSGKPPEILGVDAIKLTVYQYLSADRGAVGYSHFPVGRSDEYYSQLTGERLIVVQKRGKRATRAWKPIYPNVEALDCRVYAYAALLLHGTLEPRILEQPKPLQARQPRNIPRQAAQRPLIR